MINQKVLKFFFKFIRRTSVILVIAFFTFVVVIGLIVHFYLIITSIPKNDEKEMQLFLQNKESFDRVNEYALEKFDLRDGENERSVLVWYEEGEFSCLYDDEKEIIPDEKLVSSLEDIKDALCGGFEYYIDITKDRVSYSALGSRMYVYSRNGKVPSYYFSVDDGKHPERIKLGDGWFLQKIYLK